MNKGNSINLNENYVKNHENTSIEEINLINYNEPDTSNEQNKVSNGEMMPNKLAMYFLNLENALQYIEIENPYTNKICKLLVDSGDQLNIIKSAKYPQMYHWKVRRSNCQQ